MTRESSVSFEDYLDSSIEGVQLTRRREARRRRRETSFSQRVLYYISTAIVVLLVMLYVAQSINPTDSEMRSDQLAAQLAPWDGVWKGTEHILSAEGSILEQREIVAEFWSSTRQHQSLTIVRREDGEPRSSEMWMLKVDDAGDVLARGTIESANQPPMEGVVTEGLLMLHTNADGIQVMRRARIVSNTLHLDDSRVDPSDPSASVYTSAILQRQPH